MESNLHSDESNAGPDPAKHCYCGSSSSSAVPKMTMSAVIKQHWKCSKAWGKVGVCRAEQYCSSSSTVLSLCSDQTARRRREI